MKVLVCGGREYADWDVMWDYLDILHCGVALTHIIHGHAPGADRLADQWAREHGVQRVIVPADWEKLGKRAGPVRNRRMLELMPDLVVAFPGGRGTADMSRQAEESGVEVHRVAVREEYGFAMPPHKRALP